MRCWHNQTAQEERKMNTTEIKKALKAKMKELGGAGISKDDIAIEQNAEMFDTIQRTTERELALASLSRNWQTSGLVAEALKRVDTGTYGICADCEEPIGEKRLKAIPWAKYCIRCQEMADKMAAHADFEEQIAA